jgi:PIN domain nuclease of toxin-antitoxin system
VRVLLDTHCWLWLQVAPERIAEPELRMLESPESEPLLSAASAWEIAIKYALGRLPLPSPPGEYVPDRMRSSGVAALAVEHRHALQVATLPLRHRDPFDRLLVAQAQLEGIPILTADAQLEAYEVEIRRAA